MKNKNKINKVSIENKDKKVKRSRRGKYPILERALSIWFKQMRTKKSFINGSILSKQANILAAVLKIPNFSCSSGWLSRWKKKENIKFSKAHGEKGSANQKGADEWVKNVLPNLLNGYDPEDVYNADETGLFFKALPEGSFIHSDEKLEGQKGQKQRLTLLFLCNMSGTDKQVFVIGKAERPACFRKKRQIPLPYFSSKKAWMTSSIWTTILSNFDQKMKEKNKKILLFVDNAPCHILLQSVILENITVHFLPNNTTSIIQPLDQGIIGAFKANYRKNIFSEQCLWLEKGSSLQDFARHIDVFEAMNLIKSSWSNVTQLTIQNCFRHSGFKEKNDNLTIPIDKNLEGIGIPNYLFGNYPDDSNLQCYEDLSDERIIDAAEKEIEKETEEEKKVSDQDSTNQQSREKAIEAFFTLRSYFEDNDIDMNSIYKIGGQLLFIQSKMDEKK